MVRTLIKQCVRVHSIRVRTSIKQCVLVLAYGTILLIQTPNGTETVFIQETFTDTEITGYQIVQAPESWGVVVQKPETSNREDTEDDHVQD